MFEKYGDSLEKLGLSKNEIKTLLFLYRNGYSNATRIATEIKIMRPNVYDVLNSLVNKGLIARIAQNKEILYKGVDSAKLVEYSKFIENQYKDTTNRIVEFAKELEKTVIEKYDVDVLIYKGFKGARLVLFESLKETEKTKKEILGIGVRNKIFFSEDPLYYKRYMKKRGKMKIKGRYLLNRGEKIRVHKNTEIRVLDKIEKNPTAVYIYGNRVSLWLWFKEPLVIVIESKDITDAYRQYFDYLWQGSIVYE